MAASRVLAWAVADYDPPADALRDEPAVPAGRALGWVHDSGHRHLSDRGYRHYGQDDVGSALSDDATLLKRF
jgi:hypothetical protein